MKKRLFGFILSIIMVISCLSPISAYADTANYEVSFVDENGDAIDSTYLVKRGTCIDESLIPALPRGTDGRDYIAEDGGKNHCIYSWSEDPYTTVIYSNTVFTRIKDSEKHDYNFGKPQFKFQANNKSGLMAFYECSKCVSVGEVGVEIVGANLTDGIRIRVDGSAIGGDSVAYEGNLDIGELQTLVNLMQKVGVPIPGWVNTVLSVADTVLGVADDIQERNSTCAKEGHLYGEEPKFTWSDNHCTCIATFTCTREDCHTNYDGHTTDVTMNVTGPTYTNATCTINGEETFNAHVKFRRGRDLEWEDYYTSYTNIWQRKFGHSFSERVPNGDATCFEDGTYSQSCTRCGTVISKPDPGSQLQHTPGRVIIENEVPATCTSAGSYDAVRNCIYCNNELSRQRVSVDKLEHTPLSAAIEDLVPASCTSAGSYNSVVRCADCNKILSSTPITIQKKEHNFRYVVDNYTDANCELGGSFTRYKKCMDCGLVDSSENVTIPQKPHDFVEVVTPATCEESGSIDMVCSFCGYSYQSEVLEAIGEHDYEIISEKAPTCKEKGETVKRCRVCGDTVSEVKEKTQSHAYGTGVVTEPTCTAKGYTTYTCAVCGKTRADEIPSTGHNYTSSITAPTCENAGYTTFTCSKCHDSYKDEFRPAKGHNLGLVQKENVVESTCTENGTYDLVVKCSVCNKEIEREHCTSRLAPHQISTQIIAPTCNHEGYTTDKCDICGYEFRLDIDCIDHIANKPIEEIIKPVTCTEDGSYDKVTYCKMCNCELSREHFTSNRTGHKWNGGVITVQPTIDETGIKTFTCKNCGLTRTEVIPKITVEEATPDDKDADDASVNGEIKKPENIRTISQFNKKRLLIKFDKVEGSQNYRVMFRKAGATNWNYAWTDGKTEYYLTNLKSGGLYEFMFAAYKKNSNDEWERGAYSKTSYRYYFKEKIKSVKPGKKSVTVNWARDKKGNGYELFYSTKADMSNRKKIVIKNKKTTKYTIKKLKSGKKYYIRVRSIKKKGKRSYTGEFSSRKKIIVK